MFVAKTSIDWFSMAASADGKKLAAIQFVNGGFRDNCYIWSSSNSGVSWGRTNIASNEQYSCLAITSSADGTKLAVTMYKMGVYTSNNSGTSWTNVLKGDYSTTIASSADGSKLAFAVTPGNLYTSNNSGTSWTLQSSAGYQDEWTGISMSSDGSKIAAATNKLIYTSSDFGVSWALQTSGLPASNASTKWTSIASSTDGIRLAVADASSQGLVYISTNSGASWNHSVSFSNSGCLCPTCRSTIRMSGDGSRIAVTGQNGFYLSSNGGASWAKVTSDVLPTNDNCNAYASYWSAVALSADGTKIAAAYKLYSIYISSDSGISWATGY